MTAQPTLAVVEMYLEGEKLRSALRDQIAARMTPLVEKYLKTAVSENDPRLMSDLNFDSLDLLELVMAVEEDFAIHISDHELEKFTVFEQGLDDTFKDWCNFISSKLV